MFTKEALEYLSQQGCIQTFADEGAIALPSGMQIHSLEKYAEHRLRFSALYETKIIDEFVAYTIANSEEGTAAFVDPDSMTATVFFDLGDVESPRHAAHRATLAMRKSPEFDALLRAHGQTFSQQALAEWLEDWKSGITLHAESIDSVSGISISFALGIRAIRTLTIKEKGEKTSSVQPMRASRSTLEQIEVDCTKEIPHWMIFSCAPYEGLMNRSFTARFAVLTGDDEPKFTLRIMELDSARSSIAHEFRDRLASDLISKRITTRIGTLKVL